MLPPQFGSTGPTGTMRASGSAVHMLAAPMNAREPADTRPHKSDHLRPPAAAPVRQQRSIFGSQSICIPTQAPAAAPIRTVMIRRCAASAIDCKWNICVSRINGQILAQAIFHAELNSGVDKVNGMILCGDLRGAFAASQARMGNVLSTNHEVHVR